MMPLLKYLTPGLFSVLLLSQACAQKIIISITDLPASTSLFLNGFYGEESYRVDSFNVKNNLPNQIELPKLKPGLYSFHLLNGDTSTFVIGADSALRVTASYADLVKGKLKFNGSAENSAYQLLLQHKGDFRRAADSIEALDRKMDEFDPQYETRSLQMRNALIGVYNAYNEKLNKLERNYPGTYTATILAPLLKVPMPEGTQQAQFDNLVSFNHYHFFKNIPVDNEGILSSPYFEEKLKIYLSRYTHHGNDELLKKDLIYMIDSISSDEAVREFIRYAMMKYYVKNGPGKMVDFLAGLNAGVCEASIPFQKNVLLKNIMSVMPGRPAPQLTLKDYDGATRSFTGVLTGKKAGVVVFWASWCGHCRDTIPVLYQWYKQERNKGLEVYSVSLDDDKYQWHTFTETYTPDWVNVSELKGWESESAIIYKIRATPTYIAVDGQGKIILKTNSTQELKNALAPVLGK